MLNIMAARSMVVESVSRTTVCTENFSFSSTLHDRTCTCERRNPVAVCPRNLTQAVTSVPPRNAVMFETAEGGLACIGPGA